MRFYEEENGEVVWEGFGDFAPNDVHRQVYTADQAQQSWQEARDHGQSRRKPNMTDSLCMK